MIERLRLAVLRTVRLRHPGQFVVVAFGAAIAVVTLLLSLPMATTGPGRAPLLTALFTATSAICVTGHIVVDTPTYWSNFGEVVIAGAVQLGGFGIMTLSSLLVLLLSRRIGLRRRMLAQAETGALDLGDVRRVLGGVAFFTVLFEVVAALVLGLRFWSLGEGGLGRSLYLGVFHSITAFNNAGFALYSDNLIGFATDPVIIGTVGLAVILGGIGFPVLLELRRQPLQPKQWTLHTQLTLATTAVLLVAGMAAVLLFEWTNPGTLGPQSMPEKLLSGWFQGVTPRTAGFNSVDYGEMREATLLVTDALMFIGAGSASTAGGIKVTTFALLGFVIWAEVRGDPDVNLFGRRTPTAAQRQALAIALLGIGAVIASTLILTSLDPISLSAALFEALSAFGTVGLSTGITADLHSGGKLVLIALMFLGRVGPTTLFAALVLRERDRMYRFAEERPIIG